MIAAPMRLRRAAVLAAVLAASAAGDPATAAGVTARAFVGRTTDTDAVRLQQRGAEFEWAVDDLRLGGRVEHLALDDPAASGRADGLMVRAGTDGGDPSLRIEGHAGVVRLAVDGLGRSAPTRPQAGLRVRWRPATRASVELRIDRRPLLASPALLVQRVDLSDRRLTATWPLADAVAARIRLQHAGLHELTQRNRRVAYQLGAVVWAHPTTELSLSYGELRHRRPALSPYSAPRHVQTAELALYGEWENADSLAFVVDAGIGRQQVERFGESPRAWTGVARLLASVSAPLGEHLRVELGYEYNDSPLGGRGGVPTAQWRSRAVNLAVQVGLGR